jgi:cell division septum initiation protein DivIVA
VIRVNSEPVTADVVRSAAFSTTRMGRRGLDESEVRTFCHWLSDGIGRLLNENSLLQAEVMRLRTRLLDKGKSGVRPEDAHVQAVNLLSRAQEMADRYVADAQVYSDVCRTHLRAYMESLTRSIEEWERAERGVTAGSRYSGPHAITGSAPRVLPAN